LWRDAAALAARPHVVTVGCGSDGDTIRVLDRPVDDAPRRGLPIAPGINTHALGAGPELGINGTQLGQNRNGKHW
jgi:Icc protein